MRREAAFGGLVCIYIMHIMFNSDITMGKIRLMRCGGCWCMCVNLWRNCGKSFPIVKGAKEVVIRRSFYKMCGGRGPLGNNTCAYEYKNLQTLYPYPRSYVQPLIDNNQSARAAEQWENIHNTRCFVRQTLSALAAK